MFRAQSAHHPEVNNLNCTYVAPGIVIILLVLLYQIMHLGYILAVRNGIKNQFFKRNEKTGRKWLKYFLCHQQEISVTNIEGLHSQERGVSLLNQQLSTFKSKSPLCTPFNIILQEFTIATKPASLLYSTNTQKCHKHDKTHNKHIETHTKMCFSLVIKKIKGTLNVKHVDSSICVS